MLVMHQADEHNETQTEVISGMNLLAYYPAAKLTI